MNNVIIEIRFNWFFTAEHGEEYEIFRLGEKNVVSIFEIEEKVFQVRFTDNSTQYIYNPNRVYFGQVGEL